MFYDSIEIDLLNDSNREMLTENRMAIKNCVLTEATVNEYYGKNIKGYHTAGLKAEQKYRVKRPLEEIEKVLLQYNGLDLIDDHHQMNGLKDNRKFAVGATGESATIDGYKVLNTLFVTDKEAIRDINMATKSRNQFGKRCLSCSYDYTPVFESGVWNNQHYDLWIKDLKLDHVALVQEGRVESAQIADSNDILKGINYMKEFMKSALKGIFGIETIDDSQLEQVMILNDKTEVKDSVKYEGKAKESGKYNYSKDKEDKDKVVKDADIDEPDDIDDETPEEKKERKNKKEIKDKEDKDKEIKDAVDKQLKEIRNVHSLCEKAIGTLSDSALELDKEVLLNDTLTKLGHKVENKSYEMQKVMLETLVNANVNTNINKNISINDSISNNNKSFVYTLDNLKQFGGNK